MIVRKGTLFCMLIAAAGAGIMFMVAHQAQLREHELDRLQHAIRNARESIAVLEAEWAYLNQPQRLQQLGTRYLNMAPLTPDRIVRLEDLPLRPQPDREIEPSGPINLVARRLRPGERIP